MKTGRSLRAGRWRRAADAVALRGTDESQGGRIGPERYLRWPKTGSRLRFEAAVERFGAQPNMADGLLFLRAWEFNAPRGRKSVPRRESVSKMKQRSWSERAAHAAVDKQTDAIEARTRIPTPGQPTGSVLTISSCEDDHVTLRQMLQGLTRVVPLAHTYRQALERVRSHDISVLICERNLPDGNWKDVLSAIATQPAPPALIVACRLADEHLWAEVLNLGGYDVLAKPFDAKEVLWTVNHACCRGQIRIGDV